MTSRTKKTERGDRITAVLLKSPEVAKMLGISEQHLFRLNAAKKIPAPIKLGKSIRWRKAELINWISSGAPDLKQWLKLKEN